MNERPLASIVVNNYNYGDFLRQAIDSALAQTYPNTEVIVVDDGSTDHSREHIRQYAGRITAVLKPNEGQASAFNAGFEVCHGELIVFLDADDLLLPTAVERAMAFVDEPRLVKVHWPLAVIDEAGQSRGFRKPVVELPEGDLRDHVLRHGPISTLNPPTSGNAWTRSFLGKVFPVRECGDKHGADAYLFTLAPVFGLIRRIAQPQGCFREHAANFSGRGSAFRIQRDLQRYEHHCAVLSEHLGRMGTAVDPDTWKGPDTPYGWMTSMLSLAGEIEDLVPAGGSFILVDEDQLGVEFFPGWRAIPFLEKDGRYWGIPSDERVAMEELERLRGDGADFIVFVSSCFWWLEHYAGLHRHLRSHYRRVKSNDRLQVFDLRRQH